MPLTGRQANQPVGPHRPALTGRQSSKPLGPGLRVVVGGGGLQHGPLEHLDASKILTLPRPETPFGRPGGDATSGGFGTPEPLGLKTTPVGPPASNHSPPHTPPPPTPVYETQPFKHTTSTEGPILSPCAGVHRLQRSTILVLTSEACGTGGAGVVWGVDMM